MIRKVLGKILRKDEGIGAFNQKVREVWLEETLKKIPAGNSILDAGAGELQYKKFCGHLKYTSQDFGQYDGSGNHEGLQTKGWDQSKLDIISDITSIPRDNNSFDAVMCIEVLEHLPYPDRAIKEFARLLKTGGKLIVTSPFCSLTHFAPYHFSTGFSKYYYKEVLNNYGFEILKSVPNGNYYEYLAQEIRRVPKIAGEYSKSEMNIFEKKTLQLVLNILNKYNKKDTGSHELLCHGYHILAQKI